ncbi:MAG: single-stranded DNA-binding protein [Elusimicrobia bacterium]|nr:single-stranded DNA-binding protein [Elusimicrobiota bacterium]
MNIKLPEQNSVIITGRLTRDPNVSYTQKGSAVCLFDVAVNRRYLDKASNEWKDDTTFVPVVAWGQIAERCKDKLKKGSPVHVEGRLTSGEYTGKDGVNRKTLKVVANRIQFLASAAKESKEAEESLEDSQESGSVSGISEEETPF